MKIMKNPSDLDAYIDLVVLYAPNRFPKVGPFCGDPAADVAAAFTALDEALPLLKRKIQDEGKLDDLKLLLDAARAAYLGSDDVKGAHLLQDFQDTAFPERFSEQEAKQGA